jgi:hypothetical protein
MQFIVKYMRQIVFGLFIIVSQKGRKPNFLASSAAIRVSSIP